MGADTAVHLTAAGDRIADAGAVAALLAEEIRAQAPDLVFMGKKSVDADMAAVPAMTAALLDLPLVTAVSSAEYRSDGAELGRDTEDGREILDISFPCVLTTDKGLNSPRYATLKGIMQAKKKPIETKEVQYSGMKTAVEGMSYPPAAAPGRIIGSGSDAVPELIRLLRDEAKVLE